MICVYKLFIKCFIHTHCRRLWNATGIFGNICEYYHYDNGLWKVSPNIQYLFGNYLSSLPINKKCISFYLFCLLLNCMPELIFSNEVFYCFILSRATTGQSFDIIGFVEVEVLKVLTFYRLVCRLHNSHVTKVLKSATLHLSRAIIGPSFNVAALVQVKMLVDLAFYRLAWIIKW